MVPIRSGLYDCDVTRRLPAPGTLSPMYFLFAASQRVGALLAEALADAPLDAAAYAFYSALRETQPTSPTDLARHLGMPVTTVLDTLGSLLASRFDPTTVATPSCPTSRQRPVWTICSPAAILCSTQRWPLPDDPSRQGPERAIAARRQPMCRACRRGRIERCIPTSSSAG